VAFERARGSLGTGWEPAPLEVALCATLRATLPPGKSKEVTGLMVGNLWLESVTSAQLNQKPNTATPSHCERLPLSKRKCCLLRWCSWALLNWLFTSAELSQERVNDAFLGMFHRGHFASMEVPYLVCLWLLQAGIIC
jgi:hypothetical protein